MTTSSQKVYSSGGLTNFFDFSITLPNILNVDPDDSRTVTVEAYFFPNGQPVPLSVFSTIDNFNTIGGNTVTIPPHTLAEFFIFTAFLSDFEIRILAENKEDLVFTSATADFTIDQFTNVLYHRDFRKVDLD